MKWFKHMSDASHDEFLEGVLDEFGLEGYARWWLMIETIAKQMDKSNKCSVVYSWVKWQTILKGKRNKLQKFLVHCENEGKIKLEQNENKLEIKCANMLKLRDNYTKDLEETLEVTSPPASKQEVEVEVEVEVEEKEPEKPRASNQFKKPSLEELKEYFLERGCLDLSQPEQWLDYYTSNGWKVGKNAMKDWKATVRTWMKRASETGGQQQSQNQISGWGDIQR